MMMKKHAFCAFAMAIGAACPAAAQTFPNKPITILVGFAPGNSIDTPLRMLLPHMQKTLGQPVNIDYKPGAGGNLAYEAVGKHAAPDGYTLVASTSGVVTVPLFSNVSFDPLADLPPVAIVARFRTLLTSPAAAPWNDFKGMIAHAKANPGKNNIGFSTTGGAASLIYSAVKQHYGVDLTTVLYRGTPEQTTALINNEIQLGFLGEAAIEQQKAGRLKMIAVTGTSRLESLPDVPTFEEVGIGMNPVPDLWIGIHARGGTPKPIMDRLYKAFSDALTDPQTREQLVRANVEIVNMGPDDAAKSMKDMFAASKLVADKAGIKPQ